MTDVMGRATLPRPRAAEAGGPLSFTAIDQYEIAHPDMPPEAVGWAMISQLSKRELQEYAVAYIADCVAAMRRARARQAETAAERAAADRDRVRAAAEEDDDVRRRREDRLQRILDEPGQYAGNARDRREFRRWAGDRFGDWYRRGREATAARGEKQLAFFEADWNEGGPREYFAIRRAHRTAQLIDETAREVRLETTRDLLATVFALGDGAETTWGEATAGQHRQRVEMLARNATGVIETAARHEAAIRMIEEAGVTCLADLAAPGGHALAAAP